MGSYTYLYLREDGTPYYVGKGTLRRAFDPRRTTHMPPDRNRILIQEFPSEEDAFLAERFLIALYGRKDLGEGTLRNRTNGGEGTSGRVMSPRSRLAISQKHKGKHLSESHKAAVSKGLTGFKHTEETKAKMSLSRKGKVVSRSMLGKHHTETSKKKTQESLRLWWAKKKEGTCSISISNG